MTDKCWCRKLLAIPRPHPSEATHDPTRWICPEHGASYFARPCPRATDYDDAHKRRCSVGGGFDMMAVVAQERFCVGCFVPPVVEAVKAWDEVHVISPAEVNRKVDALQRASELNDAALAALDQAKGEEARDEADRL